MPVLWLIQAQDALQNSLGTSNLLEGSYERQIDHLSNLLEATFPDAEAILVVECLQGFSVDSPQRSLRIEAVERGVSQAKIVKVGNAEVLAQELRGWKHCRRPAGDRGRVFMELAPGKPSADGTGFETIVYEDAQQTLRAAQLQTLEQAVCQCCRWGKPSADSLEGILDQVFAEMFDRLYAIGAPAELSGELARGLETTLNKGKGEWKQPGTLAEQCRRVTLATLPGDEVEFFDPVDYLPRLFGSATDLPGVFRGPAHGDLHGRNVLVGIVNEQARFPAVFDYELMALDRLPGWDFVKLEMELKIRALQEVFSGSESEFVQSVCEFEQALSVQTEEQNNQTEWTRVPSPRTPRDRLRCILLALRGQAKRCLETLPGRSRSWLHEYYFLLSVYSVYSGKFGTYRRRDLIAAFLCGGLAAARFAWAKSSACNERLRAVHQAQQSLLRNDAAARPEPNSISHHAAFAFGREFARSRQQPFVQAAIEILLQLREAYPFVIDIGQELALAIMENSSLMDDPNQALSESQRAETLLTELHAQFPIESMETICRWGRLWKDRGDELYDSSEDAAVTLSRQAYRTALSYYQKAYQLDQHYYPGINAATLSRLTGNQAQANRIAQQLIQVLEQGHHCPVEEQVWVLATLGEAHLIVGACRPAADYYRRAVAHPDCRRHDVEAMQAQVNRILREQPCPNTDFGAIFRSRS